MRGSRCSAVGHRRLRGPMAQPGAARLRGRGGCVPPQSQHSAATTLLLLLLQQQTAASRQHEPALACPGPAWPGLAGLLAPRQVDVLLLSCPPPPI